MTRVVDRAFFFARSFYSSKISAFRSSSSSKSFLSLSRFAISSSMSSGFDPCFRASFRESSTSPRAFGVTFAVQRGYSAERHKSPTREKEKGLDLFVRICIEEDLPEDPEILRIADMLRLDVPLAIELGFDRLKNSEHKTRDTAIDDVVGVGTADLSLLLCNDEFIRKLNKEWRDVDDATDVLSMSQHVPGVNLPVLMLGDIVISVETAAKQAEERRHTLLDEIRILTVHGLLHLLGFDHEISTEAEAEMEEEEEFLLKNLGWKGKGLILSAFEAATDGSSRI